MSEGNGHPISPMGYGDGNGDGRRSNGQFAPGHKFAKGNPLNRRAQLLRSELLRAVTRQDVKDILAALIAQAKTGDVAAAREVLDRTCGKVSDQSALQRVEEIERLLAAERGGA